MDAILDILKQLEINSSIFIQLAIFVGIFVVAKLLFLTKLQFVIEQREKNTHLLDKESEAKMDSSKELSEKYKEIIDEEMVLSRKEYEKKRTLVMNKENNRFKNIETQIEKKYKLAKTELDNDLKTQKESVFKEKEKISEQLLDRFI